ncbi:molybdopterin-binding protein [Aestuariivita sp.]|jgi:molybdenum cofactor cytidylyltransferase|uniref:molybdopterin-binding protein n=1 Tax=Aestuariivita sp. TaxID=1872407 RepID=UPI00216C36DD|nr:molybdopterin-binding protein [Aestuariivita sp.]MCE8009887.1 molybdopterin-binding protein [Aestuariivita sp.]
MRFGAVPLARAEGAILAHSVRVGDLRMRKGVRLSADQVAQMVEAGLNDVVVARLEPEDLHEDEAARVLAEALVPDPGLAGLRVTQPFTGRVNLIAQTPGVVILDVAALEAFNAVHPMITIATVPAFQQMSTGGMVATIKIISYGVSARDVAMAAQAARDSIRMAPPVLRTAGLVITDIPGGPSNEKGQRAIEARVEALGMEMADLRVVPHEVDALAEALTALGGDVALILTGSATSDVEDVAPMAVRAAGGDVDRFGMPVDPGNLLFLGRQGARPVIGLPGCARSPALNGADWVLSRVVCGVAVSGADIAAMGVGGLLKEIPTRPQPRAGRKPV